MEQHRPTSLPSPGGSCRLIAHSNRNVSRSFARPEHSRGAAFSAAPWARGSVCFWLSGNISSPFSRSVLCVSVSLWQVLCLCIFSSLATCRSSLLLCASAVGLVSLFVLSLTHRSPPFRIVASFCSRLLAGRDVSDFLEYFQSVFQVSSLCLCVSVAGLMALHFLVTRHSPLPPTAAE